MKGFLLEINKYDIKTFNLIDKMNCFKNYIVRYLKEIYDILNKSKTLNILLMME
jgi:hypothetical protein